MLRWTSAQVHNIFFRKDLIVSGNNFLKREDILAHLPQRRSVLWWLTHSAALEEMVRRNPRVVHADVRGCERLSWRCFEIEIGERQPSLIALVKREAWVVGDDGSFMHSYDPRQRYEVPLPIIKGIAGENAPEIIRARLFHVKRAIDLIERETGLRVSEATLSNSGELEAQFLGRSFQGIFDLSQADVNQVSTQAIRLSRILSEFNPDLMKPAKIDLAFNNQAVVTLVQ